MGQGKYSKWGLEMSELNGSCHARDSCADNPGPTGQPEALSRIIPYLLYSYMPVFTHIKDIPGKTDKWDTDHSFGMAMHGRDAPAIRGDHTANGCPGHHLTGVNGDRRSVFSVW